MTDRLPDGASPRGTLPRVTLQDVADRAGVSPAAASLALNGRAGVSEATRATVVAVADELGYRANPLAKALRLGRTGSYALLIRNLSNPYFLDVISAAQADAYAVSGMMHVVDSGYAPEREHIERLAAASMDGLAIAPVGAGHAVQHWQRLRPGTPVVVLNATTPEPDPAAAGKVFRVSPDNVSAVEQAVAHLAELGHQRIAFLTAPAGLMADHDRLETFLEMTPALGIDAVPVETRLSLEAVEEATVDLLNGDRPPTAVITNSDHTALAVYRACSTLGVSLGADVSLVGHDNLPSSAFLDPPLTTLDVDRREIGRALFARLSGEADTDYVAPVQLVVRGSTGRPK